MSTATEPRHPTLVVVDDYGRKVDTRIPIHPQPSIFESIEIERTPGSGVAFDHVTVERVMARPKWDYSEARERLEPSVQAALAAPAKTTPTKKAAAKKAPSKDRTKGVPTPRRPR